MNSYEVVLNGLFTYFLLTWYQTAICIRHMQAKMKSAISLLKNLHVSSFTRFSH